jgi:hypothetical protein
MKPRQGGRKAYTGSEKGEGPLPTFLPSLSLSTLPVNGSFALNVECLAAKITTTTAAASQTAAARNLRLRV